MQRSSLAPLFLATALAVAATPVLAAGTTAPAAPSAAPVATTTTAMATAAPAKPVKGPARRSLDRYLKAIKADAATVQAADDAFQALLTSGQVTRPQIASVVAALTQQKAPAALVVKVLQDADRLLATKVPLGQLIRQARHLMKQDKTLSADAALTKAEQKIAEARTKKAEATAQTAAPSPKTGTASQPAPAGQAKAKTSSAPASKAGTAKK